MRTPEEALAAAREAAAASRPAGAEGLPAPVEPGAGPGRLARWALVEGDLSSLYSTRRLGAPITGVKRMLARLLRQHLDALVSQQNRFNAEAAGQIARLEERVAELERELEARGPTA